MGKKNRLFYDRVYAFESRSNMRDNYHNRYEEVYSKKLPKKLYKDNTPWRGVVDGVY
jgi:hypothetical protein